MNEWTKTALILVFSFNYKNKIGHTKMRFSFDIS